VLASWRCYESRRPDIPLEKLLRSWIDIRNSTEHVGPDGLIGFLRAGLDDPDSTEVTGEPIPIWPVFPGFAIATIAHATLACGAGNLLLLALGVHRRRRRRARGLCVHCGYDIAGFATCPECGTPVDRAQLAAEKADA